MNNKKLKDTLLKTTNTCIEFCEQNVVKDCNIIVKQTIQYGEKDDSYIFIECNLSFYHRKTGYLEIKLNTYPQYMCNEVKILSKEDVEKQIDLFIEGLK